MTTNDTRQAILKKWIDLINPNDDGTQAIYSAMQEYAEMMSVDFMEWKRKNYYTVKPFTSSKNLFKLYIKSLNK